MKKRKDKKDRIYGTDLELVENFAKKKLSELTDGEVRDVVAKILIGREKNNVVRPPEKDNR